jgi:hypothetical protein
MHPRAAASAPSLDASGLACNGVWMRYDQSSLAYLPALEPALGARRFPIDAEWTSDFDLAQKVDLLLHDAQYTREEYPRYVGSGHARSTMRWRSPGWRASKPATSAGPCPAVRRNAHSRRARGKRRGAYISSASRSLSPTFSSFQALCVLVCALNRRACASLWASRRCLVRSKVREARQEHAGSADKLGWQAIARVTIPSSSRTFLGQSSRSKTAGASRPRP